MCEKNKNGDAEPKFNISTQATLSDSWKPVRAALRYSYQSLITTLLYKKSLARARLFCLIKLTKFARAIWADCTWTVSLYFLNKVL
jgi:hypothetical protein